jgi:hypothetical protein
MELKSQRQRRSYLGLTTAWLDTVECGITHSGATKLHACQRSLDNWPRSENAVPLRFRINATFVTLFSRYCIPCALREAAWALREHLSTCAPHLWDWPTDAEFKALCVCTPPSNGVRHAPRKHTWEETAELVRMIKAVVVRADTILRLPGKRKLEYDKEDRDDAEPDAMDG